MSRNPGKEDSARVRVGSVCLPVVEALHGDGLVVPRRQLPPCAPDAIVEPLEHKIHMTFTAGISGPVSFAGGTYTVDLFTTGGTAVKWTVYWNDPTNMTPEVFNNSSGFKNPTAEAHTYTGGLPTTPITAVATDANGHNSTTAYLGLVNSFGNPVGTGKSLYSPTGINGPVDKTVVAVDGWSSSPTYGDSYTAWSYKPSGATHYEFAIPRWSSSGPVDGSWGSGGTLAFNFDSGDDTPSSIVVSSGGSYVVVAGKCTTGWAMAIIDSYTRNLDGSYGTVDARTLANFHAGQVNALAYDETDGDIVAVGDDGSGKMAASLFQVASSGGNYSFSYKWSPNVKTYDTGGVSNSATAAVIDIGGEGDEENPTEGKIVIGGNTVHCEPVGTTSDFTMVALNQSDGSVISAFGSNGILVCPNIGYELGGCCGTDSYDSETCLLTWFGNGNYYLTAGGQTGYNGGEFALFRYVCSFDGSGNLTGASPDTSFGQHSNGIATGPAGTAAAGVQDPATGNIYMAGSTSSDVLVAAFDSSGSLVSGFGHGGVMQTDLGSSTGNSTDVGWGIDLETDGSILVSAQSDSNLGRVALIDYLPSNDPA